MCGNNAHRLSPDRNANYFLLSTKEIMHINSPERNANYFFIINKIYDAQEQNF